MLSASVGSGSVVLLRQVGRRRLKTAGLQDADCRIAQQQYRFGLNKV